MYLSHFGLTELPFTITPDTEFFFASRYAQEALNTLLVAIKTGEGFVKVTGEVGTGKTMLCRKLMASLEGEYTIAYVPNPHLEPASLFLAVAAELGLKLPAQSPQFEVLQALNDKLLTLNAEGKRVVICLDEVQAMPIETLEALRLLSNLETEKRKLLQVIVFGQPELEQKLDHPSIRQLKQRIAFDYKLRPLNKVEIDYYIQHRLMVAGHRGTPLFTRGALAALKTASGCVPRLINILAHKSLLSAFGKGRKEVTRGDVLAAVKDTSSVSLPNRWPWAAAALVLVMALAAAWAYHTGVWA